VLTILVAAVASAAPVQTAPQDPANQLAALTGATHSTAAR
jgi:hypothetical protein